MGRRAGNVSEPQPPPYRSPDDFEPDPVIEAYKKHVDRTLIREQLRRSVDDRVKTMLGALRFAEELGAAGRRQRRS